MPEFLISKYPIPFYLGGTSVLIVVIVAMDTVTQSSNKNDESTIRISWSKKQNLGGKLSFEYNFTWIAPGSGKGTQSETDFIVRDLWFF